MLVNIELSINMEPEKQKIIYVAEGSNRLETPIHVNGSMPPGIKERFWRRLTTTLGSLLQKRKKMVSKVPIQKKPIALPVSLSMLTVTW